MTRGVEAALLGRQDPEAAMKEANQLARLALSAADLPERCGTTPWRDGRTIFA